MLSQLITTEPLLGDRQRSALRQVLSRLVAKLQEPPYSRFDLFKAWHTLLPALRCNKGQ